MSERPALAAEARHRQFLMLTAELGLSDAEASRVLGYSKGAWSLYRSAQRRVPRYVIASLSLAAALKQAAPDMFKQLINDSRNIG